MSASFVPGFPLLSLARPASAADRAHIKTAQPFNCRGLVFILLFLLPLAAFAQQKVVPRPGFRMLRPEEVTFYATVQAALYDALPHEYKGWKVVGDARDSDPKRRWCAVDPDYGPCYGVCPEILGKTEAYQLNFRLELSDGGGTADAAKVAAFKQITDYTDRRQIATALKMAATGKLIIRVALNLDGGDFLLSRCAAQPAVTLRLPVPATLALEGLHGPACPFVNGGQPDMSGDNYFDDALIFLGMPAASKTPDDREDGQERQRYSIAFDKTKTGKTQVQNIAIQIEGDRADIDAMVSLIDWQKLNALLTAAR